MRRVSFPNAHQEQLSEEVSLLFGQIQQDADQVRDIHDLFTGFSEVDFRNALLDPSLPHRYATLESAHERVQALDHSSRSRRPIGAYLLDIEIEGDLQSIGMSVQGVTTTKRLFDDRKRNLASWFDAERVSGYGLDPLEIATKAVTGAVVIARRAGLKELGTVTPQTRQHGRLMVPENVVDLRQDGFRADGSKTVVIERKEYTGKSYSLKIS